MTSTDFFEVAPTLRLALRHPPATPQPTLQAPLPGLTCSCLALRAELCPRGSPERSPRIDLPIAEAYVPLRATLAGSRSIGGR